MPLTINDLQIRSKHGHCSIDATKETCEKFFQIWSHKAANISNDLIEFTIRRMQSDRLRFLFQTRNEITQRESISPICQISTHIGDDLQRINEHIRRFCLSTRNLYRHLRSDSRIYPKMCIELDEGIIIKICRFIFKTKVIIKILSKQQHLSVEQREQLKNYKIKQNDKQSDIYDPYRNITKAFIALQSNFEILFGDIKKSKNKNASTTNSISLNEYNQNTNSIDINNIRKKFKSSNSDHTQTSNKRKLGWTTWLHNTNLNFTTILPSNQTNNNVNPSKPLFTTWALLERVSKM
ncbi:unnamed protein product [Rotaria sp. Silwood2]|nr:unnamed protein product [Rotaria sp. Silwood2]